MNLRDLRLRELVSKERLRRPPLRAQLTVLYAGLVLALVAAVLGVSGLLVRHTTEAAPRGQTQPSGTGVAGGGRSFDVGPAIVGLGAGLVALWLAWWIAGRFLRPLGAMNAAAREISATNLHRRLGVNGPSDELTELGRTLDELFARLEASFESQRRFVANASHELRTPLAGQRTLLQVALADPDASSDELRAACEAALQLGEQQERLIGGLLTLATSERGIEQRETFDLGQVARAVLADRRREADQRSVRINANLDRALAVGDAGLVASLVANLVDNALRHNVAGGDVDISTSSDDVAARLTVSNSGPVLAPDQVERMLEPFQHAGRQRVRLDGGHGLGLAIVQAIAQAHGAALSARGRPGGGLTVEVVFSRLGSWPS
jgi:signal transduction histidine kinase